MQNRAFVPDEVTMYVRSDVEEKDRNLRKDPN